MHRCVFSIKNLLRAGTFLDNENGVADSCINSVEGEHIYLDSIELTGNATTR